MSKGHKEDVHYTDAKEHHSTFVKNVTLDSIETLLKHTIFLKYSEYKDSYNSFCIEFVFIVVCINKSNHMIKKIVILFHEKARGILSSLASV